MKTQWFLQFLGEAGVIEPDSDTKKKSTKPSKVESDTQHEAKVESKDDSSVDVDSKTEDSE